MIYFVKYFGQCLTLLTSYYAAVVKDYLLAKLTIYGSSSLLISNNYFHNFSTDFKSVCESALFPTLAHRILFDISSFLRSYAVNCNLTGISILTINVLRFALA
jgi:hypothetical protein